MRDIRGYIGRSLEWVGTHTLFRYIRGRVGKGRNSMGGGTEAVQKVTERRRSYAGQYVALDPSAGHKVIAHGSRSNVVAAKARRAGVEVPVIVYVPEKNAVCLY